MNEETKRKAIRRYFYKTRFGAAIGLLLIGLAIAFVSGIGHGSETRSIGIATGLLIGAVGLLLLIVSIIRKMVRPDDKQIDEWFREDLEQIKARSLNKLGLHEDDVKETDPLPIQSPVLWRTIGIPNKDLLYRKGRDGTIRFTVYRVVIIQLARKLLAAYSCDFNFLKNVKLNEETKEFHYRDIVSVSTNEMSSSYKLPSGNSLVHAQAFRISAVNGESIEVIIGTSQIRKITGGAMPETGAEKAVAVIRSMLRDNK